MIAATVLVSAGCSTPGPTRAAKKAVTKPAAVMSGDPLLALLKQRGLFADSPEATPRGSSGDTVIAALAFLDLPYVYGGTSASTGFDCSGFTRYLYWHTLGHQLPRTSAQQAFDNALVEVDLDQVQPGDLVFFDTQRKAHSHVGIYVGDGRFVHAPRTGAAVRLESMRVSYWSSRFNGARRLASLAETGAASPGE